MIDVREFLRTHSVEQLNRSAEDYFSKITDWTYLLAKPFADPQESTKLLAEFCAALSGLEVCSGMKVLDFGPGSCWTSHLLTQMGCKVYACDISASALEIGRARYRAHPPFGTRPDPEFLTYDGFRFPLDDKSVDRILCMHALHHVPNVSDVIREMARVLNDLGIAAFAEPGPEHSRDPVSQAELQNGVLENDIVLEDIWRWASTAGFERLELTAFPVEHPRFSLEKYRQFLGGDSTVDTMILEPIRRHASATRTFFLYKEAKSTLRSTSAKGLAAKLKINMSATRFSSDEVIEVEVDVWNTGEAVWLPSGEAPGAVNFGFHLKDLGTGDYTHDYGRAALGVPGCSVPPGKRKTVQVTVPTPRAGSYELTVDLVSEQVAWFASRGTEPAIFRIEVI